MDFLGDVLKTGFQILFGLSFLGLMGFLVLVPLVMVVYTIADIFNREDLAAGKLVWTLIVLLVPFIGLAMYWLTRPAPVQPSYSEVTMRHTAQPAESTQQAPEQRRAA